MEYCDFIDLSRNLSEDSSIINNMFVFVGVEVINNPPRRLLGLNSLTPLPYHRNHRMHAGSGLRRGHNF